MEVTNQVIWGYGERHFFLMQNLFVFLGNLVFQVCSVTPFPVFFNNVKLVNTFGYTVKWAPQNKTMFFKTTKHCF